MTPVDAPNTLRLPRIIVRADLASVLMEDVIADGASSTITLFARAVAYSSDTFVNQLVALLAFEGYREILVKGASSDLTEQLQAAVSDHITLVV